MSAHKLGPGHPVRVQVQHGDVIAISAEDECPSFLEATAADRGLTRGGCFERLKAFCYAAKDDVEFVAIVQTDRLVGVEEEQTLAAALSASRVKVDKMHKRKDCRKRTEISGGEKHTSKRLRKEKRKERGGGEERTSKKAKKEHGDKQSRRRRQRRGKREMLGEIRMSCSHRKWVGIGDKVCANVYGWARL